MELKQYPNTFDIQSDIITYSKYAKYLPNENRRESYKEIIDRYLNMMYKRFPKLEPYIKFYGESLYNKEVLPSMRALQFAGEAIERNNSRLFNCSYMPINKTLAFRETMFLLLSGSGVGYSVQKKDVDKLPKLINPYIQGTQKYLIGDSIEGWADAVDRLVGAYFGFNPYPRFDFSDIRAKGQLLITSGGKAPGPEPLKVALERIDKVFKQASVDSNVLRPVHCHQIQCHIADAVLSGGIRRAAMIALFDWDDKEMLTCKTGEWWKDHPEYGRANNSVIFYRYWTEQEKQDRFWYFWNIVTDSGSGEPGIIWLNADNQGFNPCAEALLTEYSFCNLTTINASKITSQASFLKACASAAFFGTLQASFTDFHYLNRSWIKQTNEDALLGVSITGILSNTIKKEWLKYGAAMCKSTNEEFAKLIGINKAARICLGKPEGCQIGSTSLNTSFGIVSFEELFSLCWKGDRVPKTFQEVRKINTTTDRGDLPINSLYYNGYAPIKRIYLNSGLALGATLNHKYRVIRDGEYIWVPSSEIKEGDAIPYSVGDYLGPVNYHTLIPLSKNERSKYAPTIKEKFWSNISLNEDIAYFLGQYFGDGSNHTRGIRIHGDHRYQKGFSKLIAILKEQFDIDAKIVKYNSDPNDNRTALYISSVHLLKWMNKNGLSKQKSREIEIPYLIRTSPKQVIESFIEGYRVADGNIYEKKISYHTTSKKFAEQLVVVLRSIGVDSKLRDYSPSKGSFGTSVKYWVSERQGRSGSPSNSVKKHIKEAWNVLDEIGLNTMSVDFVVRVEDDFAETFDIEVLPTHTYISNSYISHNTTSLLLGTSSGIHTWHNEFFIRRYRFNKNEAIWSYLYSLMPELCEDEYFNPDTAGIFNLPLMAPKGATTRKDLDVISHLELIKTYNKEWIWPSKNRGEGNHNMSATISVMEDEWQKVGQWMWDNQEFYSGISVLPFDGGTYIQAPFEDIDEERYFNLLSYVKPINLDDVKEFTNEVNFGDQIACAGGSCELNY
jgi:ribonucleoside-triphosphate reductase